MKYAVISDIHEDAEYLEKALSIVKKEKCDKIVCLGDICGFSSLYSTHFETRNADLCIELIRENCDIVTCGNHDLNPVSRIPDYFKRLKFPDNWYNLSSNERAELSNNNVWLYDDELKPEILPRNLEFLKNLPEFCIEDTGNFKILFSHFLFPDLTGSKKGFPEKKKELTEHLDFMKSEKCMMSFVGHAHIKGFAILSGKRVFFKYFGSAILKKKEQIIYSPAVVKGKTKSGFLIFDSENLTLKSIRINL